MTKESQSTICGMSATRLQQVNRWLHHQVSCGRLAGASVLIGRHGKTTLFDAAGMADIDNSKPFDRDTVVRIYSMTKPITTVAAMMLYEQGHYQLDDPIARYLPEFANTPVWLGGDNPIDATEEQRSPITIRQLMNHTAGLSYEFMQSTPVDQYYRDHEINFQRTDCTLADVVKNLTKAPLLCQPGTQWNYSVATDVLGRLVEVWSGQLLREFLIDHILTPLEMNDTDFHVAKQNLARFSAMYGPRGGGGLGNVGATGAKNELSAKPVMELELIDPASGSRFTRPAAVYSGGGGLTGTIDDYARFCQMILNGGELNGKRLLSPLTVDYMCSNQLPGNTDMAAMGQSVWSETSYEGIGFGLGFAVVLDPVKAQTITSVGECHWGGAASTFFWVDRKLGLYTILLTQLLPSSTYPLRRELRTQVYQAVVD